MIIVLRGNVFSATDSVIKREEVGLCQGRGEGVSKELYLHLNSKLTFGQDTQSLLT